MKTDDLLAALAADTRPGPGVAQRLSRALPGAMVVAAVVFALGWGVRQDLVAAMTSPAALKPLVPLALAGLAGTLALTLSRPEARGGRTATALWVFAVVLIAAFGAALAAGGLSGLMTDLFTPSLITCLASIPALALPLLAATLWALSAGAPRRPALTGALGGLAAGSLAASLYALYCDQDTALFVLPAYASAIGIVTLTGTVLGTRTLAW
ncbi:NrsF family protein [Rhodobaculum claviforme]|uniref:RNA polymerase subunit sigma-70 n=1 Tax=Rhodobaculum claviforme TaxID=1549854 RepID=A0A934TM51_9RHOB|nr:NrsF family protein [Rhodobaculum claviforme]MBK5928056.1 RNA polymerase subunit sigma-70 [Rhodobaculum claviforme]